MTLPRTLRVMGQTHTIEAVENTSEPIEVEGHEGHGHSVLGSYDRPTLTIRVRTGGVAEDQQREALLHEALHGIVDSGQLIHYLHGDHEEPFVRVFAPQLLHFLRDNPDVVAYLTRGA